MWFFFFFQAEDGIRDGRVTGVQTCALPIYRRGRCPPRHHEQESKLASGETSISWNRPVVRSAPQQRLYTAGEGSDPSTSNSERLNENESLDRSDAFFCANSILFESARQIQVWNGLGFDWANALGVKTPTLVPRSTSRAERYRNTSTPSCRISRPRSWLALYRVLEEIRASYRSKGESVRSTPRCVSTFAVNAVCSTVIGVKSALVPARKRKR